MGTKKIIIAITGASGAIYARILLQKLRAISGDLEEVALILSKTGEEVWRYELPDVSPDDFGFQRYDPERFFSPPASGSAGYDAMIIIPCSMGTLGRIAHGTSDNLIVRAADVILKERKKLVLVPREMPCNRIHLQNMLTLTDAGGVVCPASPSFYQKPATLEESCETVVIRAMKLAGLPVGEKPWSGSVQV